MLNTGEVLEDRYRVGLTTGWGGPADVYHAQDTLTGLPVSVKMVPELSADLMALAVRDAEAIALLHDPAILTLRSWGMYDSTPYVIVDEVPGPTLAELLVHGPLREDEVVAMGAVLATALAHGHAIGVPHRDVQPGNVIVTETGAPKLNDYGLAMRADPTETLGGHAPSGVHPYLAPEQVRGEIGAAPADVYALGLVLLEALTDELAFNGSAATRLVEQPEVPDNVSPWLATLIGEMTAIDPAHRPTAATVAAALEAQTDAGAVPDLVAPQIDVVDLRDTVEPGVSFAAPSIVVGELPPGEERTAIAVAILGIVTILVITALVFVLL